MPPKRRRPATDDDVSSPDPLAFSGQEVTQPTTPKRRAPKRMRELSFDADIVRGKSPAKTVLIDPESDDGKSPYRIRVTVQAEPREDYEATRVSPAKRGTARRARTRSQSPVKVKTTTVPLRDDEEARRTRSGTPAPKKKKSTPRKSLTLTEINDWYDGSFQPGRNHPKAKVDDEKTRTHAESNALLKDTLEEEDATQLDSMVVEPSIMPSSPLKPTPRRSPRRQIRTSRPQTFDSDVEEDEILRSTEVEQIRSASPNQPGGEQQDAVSTSNEDNQRVLTDGHESAQVSSMNPPRIHGEHTSQRTTMPKLASIPVLRPEQSPRKTSRIAFSPLPSRLSNDSDLLYPELPLQPFASVYKRSSGPSSGDLQADGSALNPDDPHETNSDHGLQDEDSDTDALMSGAQPMGDDTMMKSMDMTIVSPSALYSRLDIHSSVLHGTPANFKRKEETPQHSRSSGRLDNRIDVDDDDHSSPHVQWSSPLVLQDQKHTPNTRAQPSRSASSSRYAQFEESAPTQSPRHQLPTPDSDEVDKENKDPHISEEHDDSRIAAEDEDHQDLSGVASQSSSPRSRPDGTVVRQEHIDIGDQRSVEQDTQSRIESIVPEVVDISDSTDSDTEIDQHEASHINDKSRRSIARGVRLDDDIEEDDQFVVDNEEHHDPPPVEETMDLWQQAGEQSSSFIDESRNSERPTAASFRVGQRWKRQRIPYNNHSQTEDLTTARNDLRQTKPKSWEAERPSKTMISDSTASTSEGKTIAQLFEAAFQQKYAQSRRSEELDDVSDDEEFSHQDLSALLHRRVANTMANVDISLAGVHHSPVTSKLANAEMTAPTMAANVLQPLASRLSPRPNLVLPHSPKRSSPLKQRLEDQDDETNLDHISMLSDVRQLHNEQRTSKRPALMERRPQRKSLLKLTQERQARASMVSPVNQDVFESTMIGSSAMGSSEMQDEDGSEAADHGFRLHRSLLPAFGEDNSIDQRGPSFNGSISRTHHLLDSFRLLPRKHPWSDSHFQALLSLYKHWKTHEHQYHPMNPANAGILTAQWQKYIDMEFYNWGYDLQLNESLVMIAALFSQLLQLEDAEAYENYYGGPIRFGVVAERTASHGLITDWHIILRLCTVILGDVIRAEEARGVEIDRRPALKWRMKGQMFWRRGWLAGIF